MPTAQIKFTQGATTAPAGIAVIGVTGQPVVASNGSDTAAVKLWTWSMVGVPLGSGIAVGAISSGAVPTATFTPDVTGCYLVHLVVSDVDGNLAEDYRVFAVLETSGRLIPSFRGTDASMNFGGQLAGWEPYVNAYLKLIDSLAAGTGVQPQKVAHRDVTGSGAQAWNPASDYELRLKSITGSLPISFPGSPSDGDRYAAVDVDGTAVGNASFAGAGHNIANYDGASAPASTLSWPAKKYASFVFEFTGTIWSFVG